MASAPENILITGSPGIGKTTLVRNLLKAPLPCRAAGFYTEEIRRGGVRQGFELISLDGRKGLRAHVGIDSAARVGKYGVDVAGFERFLNSIAFLAENDLIIIDEIGKMECCSDQFVRRLMEILDSPKSVVATIALKGGGVIAKIKKRSDVRLYRMTSANREALLREISSLVAA